MCIQKENSTHILNAISPAFTASFELADLIIKNQVIRLMTGVKPPIRCLLLAAGLGTRLRPITDHQPKCLVEVGGRPILEWWLDKVETIQCEKAIVNTHYHAEQVSQFLRSRTPQQMQIVERYEQKLLGTAGTLLANADFFEGSTGVLIHADNATNTELSQLIEAHQSRPEHCLLTMLTFETDTPQRCGIVEADSEGVVHSFHEKVKIHLGIVPMELSMFLSRNSWTFS